MDLQTQVWTVLSNSLIPGPKHTQFPSSVILDTACDALLHHGHLEGNAGVQNLILSEVGHPVPNGCDYVTPVCDPTEGMVCISGMRPSGHTDSAPGSTVILPLVHCLSTRQRFGSSSSRNAWILLEICSPAGYIFSWSTQQISNPPIFLLDLPDVCPPVVSPRPSAWSRNREVSLLTAVRAESIPLSFAFSLVSGALTSCFSSLSSVIPLALGWGGCSALRCKVALSAASVAEQTAFAVHRVDIASLADFFVPSFRVASCPVDRVALHGIKC